MLSSILKNLKGIDFSVPEEQKDKPEQ